ncbi:MAG: carboxylate-amine ligase [Alphaproteobacteria bacterium]|nr:carboxylate-amine ligase [Alphaproteobacteria bacterium]
MAGALPFTLGIEEEYFLVDRQSRDLKIDPPPAMMERAQSLLRDQVAPEFLKCQIEVGTTVCTSLAEARAQLALLRRTIAAVAAEFGLAPIAASTHPFAQWESTQPTDKARYAAIAQDLQVVGRRLVICGMHVHVGIPDDELRIDLMNQVRYFLPHLLMLATSSPFWRGADTGLKSYRLSIFRELPRTGLPEAFESFGEYKRHVDVLVKAGLVEDATKLWWDIRPSARFPTVEMRIADVCTRLEDALAVAAIYRCILSMLHRLRRANQRWRVYARMLIEENRWRAQRYGFERGLVDFGKGKVEPALGLVEEILALVREDAEAFGCVAEVEHARAILARGTSADRQRGVLLEALAAGADRTEALRAVVDWLIAETVAGTA